MTPAPSPPSLRVAARHARWLLPLLLLPVAAYPQGGADPAGLGYESATESHRGFNAGLAPTEPETDDMMGEGVPGVGASLPGMGSKPAGDMPAPVDPDAGESMTRGGERAAAGAPARAEGTPSAEMSDTPGWIEANDSVGEIGGWRTYARELYEPDEKAMAAKSAGAMPAPVDPDAAEKAGGPEEPAMGGASPERQATLSYDSVLDDYDPYEEADGPGWIESNDTVGEIGGWRTYARELYESDDEGDTE